MKSEVKQVLEKARTGTISVIDFETGGPFAALVNVASDAAGYPLLMSSSLARHDKCLQADKRATLLVSDLPDEGDALVGFRASITGRVELRSGDDVRKRYAAKHPYAAGYMDFADFHFWRLVPDKVYVVAGFGRIQAFAAEDIFG